MVGDGTWLKLSEVHERLRPYGYTVDRIREVAAAGYIHTVRPPATGTGTSHRRFETASVDEYETVLKLPPVQQVAALEELRRKVQAKQEGEPGPAAD